MFAIKQKVDVILIQMHILRCAILLGWFWFTVDKLRLKSYNYENASYDTVCMYPYKDLQNIAGACDLHKLWISLRKMGYGNTERRNDDHR